MRTISVSARTVRNAVAEARRHLDLVTKHGVVRHGGREMLRSGGEDGLWRITLVSGDIVEVSICQKGPTTVHGIIA